MPILSFCSGSSSPKVPQTLAEIMTQMEGSSLHNDWRPLTNAPPQSAYATMIRDVHMAMSITSHAQLRGMILILVSRRGR